MTLSDINKQRNIMNDQYLEDGNPNEYEEKEYECPECCNPVEEELEYCSKDCWEAGQL